VEAAGIEPNYPQSTNWLMAHGFSRKIDPSRGDILETALENQSLKSKGNVRLLRAIVDHQRNMAALAEQPVFSSFDRRRKHRVLEVC
jgi:CHASE1-domain containing sensor protein